MLFFQLKVLTLRFYSQRPNDDFEKQDHWCLSLSQAANNIRLGHLSYLYKKSNWYNYSYCHFQHQLEITTDTDIRIP